MDITAAPETAPTGTDPPLPTDEAAARARLGSRRDMLLFHVLTPTITAFLFAANHTGRAQYLPVPTGIAYWLGIMWPYWVLMELATGVVAMLLRVHRVPRPIVLAIGAILAMQPMSLYVPWWGHLFAALMPNGAEYHLPRPPSAALGDWRLLLGYSGIPIYWILVNLGAERVFGLTRFRTRVEATRAKPVWSLRSIAPPPPADTIQAAEPIRRPAETLAYMRLVPARIGRDVVALEAEDHYVRVHAADGNALIRYRFSDAMAESQALDGIQVHRSFWVRRASVEKVIQRDNGLSLLLSNGLTVPVSRSYRETLRGAGLG